MLYPRPIINVNDFLKLVDYKLDVTYLESVVLQTPVNTYQSFYIVTPIFFYINSGKLYNIHKKTYKKKRHNIRVCEWALDKGYVSYCGIELNERRSKVYNPSIIHKYKLTDSGSDLCAILLL